MNGTLQELVELYMYDVDDTPMCQVHFKGRLEPYDIVKVDELLGDITELSKNRKKIDFNTALNSSCCEDYCCCAPLSLT